MGREVHWHGPSVSASLDPNTGRTVPGQRRAAAIIGETLALFIALRKLLCSVSQFILINLCSRADNERQQHFTNTMASRGHWHTSASKFT